ncbi:MAG: OsmC family peroxiredoxin [Saprospirales bacterium]|nr:MAG: OsmC family peroxiredoxin [Saprospirales bacterium]
MKLIVNNLSNHLEYSVKKENGAEIILNANGKGISPMDGLLGCVAACSAVDIELILEKMRQKLETLTVEAKGKRADDQTPKFFRKMHLEFKLSGDIKKSAAEKAVRLAVEKYCSVASSLKPDIDISWNVTIE